MLQSARFHGILISLQIILVDGVSIVGCWEFIALMTAPQQISNNIDCFRPFRLPGHFAMPEYSQRKSTQWIQ